MYVIIWKYAVKEEQEREFKTIYSSDGDWAELFSRAEGYLGTELLEEADKHCSYITIDRWRAKADFDKFHLGWAQDYKKLDQKCECLTLSEERIGIFE